MELASAPLNPVCTWLIDFAIEEYVLLRNIKEEVRSLKRSASIIKAVLHDAEEKEANDKAVHVWLHQLKQILLDAEDIFDELATDAHLRRSYGDDVEPKIKVRDIVCCFGCVQRISGDHDMACRIKAIRKKLDHIKEEKNKLNLQPSVSRDRPSQHTCSQLDEDGSYFSGRDGEIESIIKVLLRLEGVVESNIRSGGVEVVVIHGVGGVGKTTLARLIFNDSRVKDHFQLRMWVCVSEDFNLERIINEIMEVALSSEERKELFDITNWDLRQRRFREKMEDKKFLLVLDDLWEEKSSEWETLVHGRKGSKIIVTTRKQKTLMMVNEIPFPLGVMSSDALWPIFRSYAFNNKEHNGNMQLEIVGRQIVEKLKGLPLAARVIGRLLNRSSDVNHWTNILKSEIFTSQRDDIVPVLKVSYDHLSRNLKQCFIYCSLFPKDYIFSKDELIQMWMAQNFIPNTTDLDAERIGHESFENLLNNSFFELDVERPSTLGIHVERPSNESFKMHDLIHDLAESIFKDDCFRLGDNNQKQMSENVRHVSITTDSFDQSKFMEVLNHENLRTLIFFHQNTFQWEPFLDDLFVKLKRLRILGLRQCKIEQLPSSIGKLKHLRFVDLSYTLISNLPDSMSDLLNLQVLKLIGCKELAALPRNTSALVNLRHLEVETDVASRVQGLWKLTALQELIVTGSKVGELADMSMLKELRIRDLEGIARKREAIQAKLESKEHLKLLELKWGNDDRPHPQRVSDEEVVDALQPMNHIRQLHVRFYEGARSPKWMEDLSWISTSFLEKIELRDCREWKVLPPLGQLPVLKFLRLSGMSGVRTISPEFFKGCDDGRGEGGGANLMSGFPSLEELAFVDMPEWEEWASPIVEQRRQDTSLILPRLRTLRLEDCPKLRELPPLPPTLTTLFFCKVGMTCLPGWMTGHYVKSDLVTYRNVSVRNPSRQKEAWINERDEKMRNPGLKSQSSSFFHPSRQNLVWRNPAARPSQPAHPMPHFGSRPRDLPPASSSSPSLSSFMIYDCPNLISLDGLLRLPMLKKLTISRCSELASLPVVLFWYLRSLEQLEVAGCPKLSLPPPSDIENRILLDMPQQLPSLTSLKSLYISNCAAITTIAPLGLLSTIEVLTIENCAECTSLGCSLSIGVLQIENCPKLLRLVKQGGEAALPSALSLNNPKIHVKTLTLWSCSLEQITALLCQVSSLQELFIRDSPGDGFGRDLDSALLNLAPSLRRLSLSDCENLSSLPSKLRVLSCLQELWIACCPKIERLPPSGLPETLKLVSIWLCPELEQRCREEGCPDWPLLSHVPDVRIGIRS